MVLPKYEQPKDEKVDEMDAAGGNSDVVKPLTNKLTAKQYVPTEQVDSLKKLGNDFLENEKYLQAIYQYTAAIRLAPDYPVLYLNRATAYMRRRWYGDVYAALRDCHSALHLDPTYIKAHFRLSRALMELDYPVEANECLKELKVRFPHYDNNHGVMMLKKDINSAMDVNCFSCFDYESVEHLYYLQMWKMNLDEPQEDDIISNAYFCSPMEKVSLFLI